MKSSNPQIPVQSTPSSPIGNRATNHPIIPPLISARPFVDKNGYLHSTSLQFLQQMFALVQGQGGIGSSQLVSKTSDYNLTDKDNGTQFDNFDANGTVIFTLPQWQPKLQFTFLVVVPQTIIVRDSIISLNGNITDSLSSNTIGSTIKISSSTITNTWTVTYLTGVWSAT